jgi:hypothetical protein
MLVISIIKHTQMTLRRAVSRTPKGAVLSGPTGVLLQMSDIKLTPNAPKEKNNDR